MIDLPLVTIQNGSMTLKCIDLLSYRQELQKYEKLEIEIKQLTGYNVTVLKELFAKGYTLQPPEVGPTLSEMAEIMEKYD